MQGKGLMCVNILPAGIRVRIGEGHGIRFPREFALLLKQFLYFDRYVQALAPELDMFSDQRVDLFGTLDQLPGDEPLH